MRSITLFFFGGVAAIEQNPPTPRAELEIAIAGPIASALLALGFSALAGVFAAGSADALMFAWLGRINLSVAVFNLLPGLPLDGGRVLRAWLWARHGDATRATRLAARVGQLLAYGLIGLGAAAALSGGNAIGGSVARVHRLVPAHGVGGERAPGGDRRQRSRACARATC